MTTRDPGASDVFTQGFGRSPRSTARAASRPAATITWGFEVFVQLVMAAITTWPSSMSLGLSAHPGRHGRANAYELGASDGSANRRRPRNNGSGAPHR